MHHWPTFALQELDSENVQDFFSDNLQCHNRQNLSGIEPLSAKRPMYCSEFSCNNATASRITYCISTILSQHGAPVFRLLHWKHET